MAQIIGFVRDGSVAYWNWVAAGANYRIMEELLQLGNKRNEGLEEQVKAEEKAKISHRARAFRQLAEWLVNQE